MRDKETTVQKKERLKALTLVAWLICIFGAIFYCYEYLLRIEPSVMLPQLMRYFDISAQDIGFLVALYYGAYVPMQAVVGILADLYGARLILTFAVFVCAIGSLLFGTTQSVYLAGFGRFLIGFGSAFAFVGVLKLASTWLPSRHFALFAGIATALGMVGAMVGDVELSILVHRVGWKAAINIGTALGFILIPFIWFIVRDRPKNAKTQVAEVDVRSALRHFFSIFANSQMWINGMVGCMLYLSLSVFAELWGIEYLRMAYHLSGEVAAASASMVFLGWLIGAPFSGWLSDKIKNRRMPLIIGGFFAFLVITYTIYGPVHSLAVLNVLLFLFGFLCSAEVICFAVGTDNYATDVSGMAIAFTNMLVMFGGFVFQPLVGKLLDVGWTGQVSGDLRIYTLSDYKFALIILPAGLLISVILALVMKESYGKVRHN